MPISFGFPFYLTLAVVLLGLTVLLDRLWLARRRLALGEARGWWVETAYGFFPVLLLVWLVRSFLIQPYRVPTGSLAPTILPGDFIAVSQYAYGLHLPVSHTRLFAVGQPQRGDIALFYFPEDTRTVYVKRVVGLPGDVLEYRDKQLVINGRPMQQTLQGKVVDEEPGQAAVIVEQRLEHLGDKTHAIYLREQNVFGHPGHLRVKVPPHQYFVMGDNRDNSYDSRYWGFVPEQYLIGRALLIWMSWDSLHHKVRWHRIGRRIS